ncbi:hypothetical protein FRT60_10515 [Pseudomonas haemolytica]|uniref:Uncharacterized protein n=1 Tax=Pseudomonas haemolytica TaxID=2600065 RepID=A0A646P179_9PSED|nr:hypothetical protein [Pseudomonas haemolytica]MRJ20760.1 hypothetical protein [Pseudomonas haemolytica]
MALTISPHINTAPPAETHAITQRENPQTTTSERPVDLLTREELLQEIIDNMDALHDPRFDSETITRDSLKRTADGVPLRGTPPTPRQSEIAAETLKRKDVFKELDLIGGSTMFPLNGTFTLDDAENVAAGRRSTVAFAE